MSSKSINIKWYDYFACVYFADLIAGGIVNLNLFLLLLGAASYILYEDWRRG
jgi:hypothetical protein